MWASRLFLLFFVIAACRFIYVQFIISDKLQAEIIENRVREVVNLPERGKITDRNGNVLAMSLISYDVAVNPNLILSKSRREKVAKLLSENIEGLEYEEILKIVSDSNLKYKMVGKRVPPEKVKIIRESGLGGIQISESPTRLYPNGTLASSILGFVNNNSDPGAGIEIQMNNFLAGTKGYTLAEMTPFGEIIPVGSQNTVTPVKGQNVNLTIDSYIQHILEQRLAQAAEELKPKEMHSIIMDPNNGEILAMASYPNYNPNEYQKTDPQNWTRNPAGFTYEPGSIFKPLITAAALSYGTLKEDAILPSGSTTVNGTRIRDWNGGAGFGMLGLKDVIRHSSNVGMINIMNTMSDQQIIDFLDKAGFGKKTGIELPGEESGFNHPTVKSLQDDPVRRANISFGQGIMTTPVQMISALSAIANGGYKVTPTLVKNVTDSNGNIIYEPSKEKTQLFTPEAANNVKSYMKYNMDNSVQANGKVPGYDGGIKTGTAWFVENGVYKKGAILGSSISFVPAENPRYIMITSVKEPQGVQYGSEAANPIFKDVMSQVLQYENIAPTETPEDIDKLDIDANYEYEYNKIKELMKPAPEFNVKDYSWQLFDEAAKDIAVNLGEAVVVTNDGGGEIVIDQTYMYKDEKLVINLITKKVKDGDNYYIPNLIGKTEEEVEKLLGKYDDLNLLIHGKNKVIEQSKEPGHYYQFDSLQLWLN